MFRAVGRSVFGVSAIILGATLGMGAGLAAQTPAPAAAPPASAPAASPPAPAASSAAPASEASPLASAEVTGFRSALFGMSEADVRAAISKDFGVAGDGVRVSQNGAEHTQVLSIKAPDVLPEGGSADVAYVFGYKTKKLIQVSITWSKATDDKLTPERLVSNADTLRAYFMSAGYKADTIVSNVPLSNGLLTFRGADAAGHTTALLLEGSFSGDKTPRAFTPAGLALFYLADAKNPDIYRVQPGKF